jgi:Putative zinc-finger
MTARLARLSLRWPGWHPGAPTLSRYHEGELTGRERAAVARHLDACSNCQALLESLATTVEALGSLHTHARPGLANSVIAALRAQEVSPAATSEDSARSREARALTLLRDSREDPAAAAPGGRPARLACDGVVHTALDYCLRRAQLRLTLPLAVLVGTVLSVINQGDMIFGGRSSFFAICVGCAPNFLIPFAALSVGLLLAARRAERRRFRVTRSRR